MAVLGSGLLSAAVVAALVESNRRLRVWGSTPSWYLSAFADAGVRTVGSPHEVVRWAGVVVLAPADHAERVGIEARLAGRIPDTTAVLTLREPADDGRWSATWLSEEHHLDCLVCGNPAGLGTESVVVLVSGSAELVERHRELLDSLGVVIAIAGPQARARRSEIALVGLWYDVSVAVLRALANIDPSARPTLELELKAIVAQLPSVIRSVDSGGPVREDIGLGLHARALAAVVADRRRRGSPSSELEQTARHIDALMAQGVDPRSPLSRIAQGLRLPDGADAFDPPGPS